MANITASMVKELREITGVAMMDCKKALVESDGDIEKAKEYLRKKGQAKAMKKSSRETREGAIGIYTSEDQKSGAIIKLACETDFVAKNDKFQSLLKELAKYANSEGTENFPEKASPDGKGTIQDYLSQIVAEIGENIQYVESQRLSVSNGVISGYVHTNKKIAVLVQLETDQPHESDKLTEVAKDIAMHITATYAEAVSADQVDPAVLEKEKEILIAQAKESGKPDNIVEKMIQGRIKKFLKEICVDTQPFVKDPQQTVGELIKSTGKSLGVNITLKSFVKFQF